MKINNEINLKRISFLTFLLSYKCTNECRHCALHGSPNQDNILMKLGDVKSYLEDITSKYIINEIGFFGGEPLLHFDLLVRLIEVIKKYGITTIGLPTNGYWGKNENIAKDYALKLKEAGLYRISFSVDAFHQEFISLDVVRTAIKASYDAGIEWIGLLAQNLRFENENTNYNNRTNEITDRLSEEFPFCEVISSELLITGRAASQLTEYFSMTKIPSDKCLIFKVPMFMIDPNGWVSHQSCQGICIGNAKEKSLSEIIEEFNYRKHPIIGKLTAKGGPQNLLEIAVEKGYKPLKGYADKCHLCYSIRSFLRPFYPDILEPSNLYY
ncbi:MAG: radical SAM protein [Promethearchaeota archaeon]